MERRSRQFVASLLRPIPAAQQIMLYILNLSVRMHNRRFTRLTNAHSKSEKHHAAMMALFVAWYNYCRKHETLADSHEHLGRKVTPAMAARLTDRVWTLADLLRAAAG